MGAIPGECQICHDVMDPAIEELLWLPCSHKYHEECMLEYAKIKEAAWTDLPCPICKVVPISVELPADQVVPAEAAAVGAAEAAVGAAVGAAEAAVGAAEVGAAAVGAAEAAVGAAAVGAAEVDLVAEVAEVDLVVDSESDAESSASAARPKAKAKSRAKAPPKAKAEWSGKAPPNAKAESSAKAPPKAQAELGFEAPPKATAESSAQAPPKAKAESSAQAPPKANVDAAPAAEKWQCVCCSDWFDSTDKFQEKHHKRTCAGCNSTRTKVFQANAWKDVLALDAKAAQEFFAAAKSMRRAVDVCAHLESLQVKNFESHREDTRERGIFLPLAVWAQKGFDANLIVEEAGEADKKYIKQMGLCYRVVTHGDEKVGSKGWVADETMSDGPSSSEPPPKAARTETIEERMERIRRELAEHKEEAKKAVLLGKVKNKEKQVLESKALAPLNDLLSDANINASLQPILRELVKEVTKLRDEYDAAKSAEEVSQLAQAFQGQRK